jgi:GNAT superfamily N-acetyltransferase
LSRVAIQPTFRRAERSDAREIGAIIFGIVCEGGPPTGLEPLTRDQVVEWIDRIEDGGAAFLAEVGGMGAGYSVVYADAHQPGTAMMRVYVREEFRLRGIGRELAQIAVDFARDAGYEAVRGFIPEDNEPALSFFSAVAPLVQLQGGRFHFEL